MIFDNYKELPNAKESDYVIVIPSRGKESEWELYQYVLNSMLNQTKKPKAIYFCIYRTCDLQHFIKGVTYIFVDGIDKDDGYSGFKVLNAGLNKALLDNSHIVISGDDSFYPNDYFSKVSNLAERKNGGIVSGLKQESGKTEVERLVVPSGSGRLHNKEIVHKLFPLKELNYAETLTMYQSEMLGYNSLVDTSTYFKHLRPSKRMSLRSCGASAYQLNYPYFQSVARVILWFLSEHKLKLSFLLGHTEAYLLRYRFPKAEKAVLNHVRNSLTLKYKSLFSRIF